MKEIIKLRKKNIIDLHTELLELFRERFNLRMQSASGKLKQPHLLRKVRRDIAKIKTLIHEKRNMQND